VHFAIVAILSGSIALLRGGRLANLSRLTIRWSALPLVALSLQIWVMYGPNWQDSRSFGSSSLLLVASFGILLLTVLINWRLPGMIWLACGVALNLVVILANGGWMPITHDLAVQSGLLKDPTSLLPGQRAWATKDVLRAPDEIRLHWLADLFMIPQVGVFSIVFSVGDALMMLGLFQLVQAGMLGKVESLTTSAKP
jgi:hypothetical protein